MNKRVLIRHSSGSKASTVEEFPVSAGRELTFGREGSCEVRYDADRDEFVSRRHMKIVVGEPGQDEFTVVDLSARNGTFVNRQRVRGSSVIRAGDLVQLGAGGPEFQFDVAQVDLRVTPVSEFARLDDAPVAPEPPPAQAPPVPERKEPAVAAPQPKGQRRGKRSSGRKKFAGVAVLALLLAGAVYLWGIRKGTNGNIAAAATKTLDRGRGLFTGGATSAEEIARQNADALVTVQSSWRLLDPATGRQLRQIYIPNRRDAADGGAALVPGGPENLPVFVLLAGNRLQPILTVAEQNEYRAIGGTSRAAGFVFTADGLVLTTRASTSPWSGPYEWPVADTAGVVAVFDDQQKLAKTAVIARRQFPEWRATEMGFVLDDAFDATAVTASRRVRGSVKSDSLVVRSTANGSDVRASVLSASEDTQLAVVQPATPIGSKAVAKAPDVAPSVGDKLMVSSGDSGFQSVNLEEILPDGRFVLGAAPATGAGSPVFDRQGRAVAVQSERDPARADRVLAIPMRRALESVGQAH